MRRPKYVVGPIRKRTEEKRCQKEKHRKRAERTAIGRTFAAIIIRDTRIRTKEPLAQRVYRAERRLRENKRNRFSEPGLKIDCNRADNAV